MENENNTQSTVYEQDMWKLQAEKTWIFTASSLSKILPAVLCILVAWWYLNWYLAWEKADAFIEIYNPNINSIAEDMTLIWENFQNVSQYYIQAANDSDLSENTIASMDLEAEKMLAANDKIYERVTTAVTNIETQACPMLEHAMTECLDFILLYRDMIVAFSSDNYEQANSIWSDMVEKSNAFVQAVKKDNIVF